MVKQQTTSVKDKGSITKIAISHLDYLHKIENLVILIQMTFHKHKKLLLQKLLTKMSNNEILISELRVVASLIFGVVRSVD